MNNISSNSSLSTLDRSILQKCIHCGMCLPSCPTYQETKIERNSPRGRISLMKAIAENAMELTPEFAHELYFCLGCLACQSACPVGVDYKTLFEASRQDIEKSKVLNNFFRLTARTLLIKFLFLSPTRLRTFGKLLRLFQKTGLDKWINGFPFLPQKLREMALELPPIAPRFSFELISSHEIPSGNKSLYKVGLLTGCVQDLVFPNINRDTADVLLHNGCEVFCPPRQGCCGSLHAHNGEIETAQQLAKALISAFPVERLDGIITNSAGCGSHLKHFAELFPKGSEWRKKAEKWDQKVYDIHEWLVKIGYSIPKPTSLTIHSIRVTYHDACHLCHGQKIKNEPRKILKSLPNVEFVELKDADNCCGSAGIYNILQPAMAKKLLLKKIERIKETTASVVCTANPGCLLFIQKGLREQALNQQPVHPISLLAHYYRLTNQDSLEVPQSKV
ncbi:(Fe-S)-binding protein [Candidatus Methylacidiphilum infernorum]|nr:(Fe-S)-binding protein [Candidatus Methylacidiphilum infernorum]